MRMQEPVGNGASLKKRLYQDIEVISLSVSSCYAFLCVSKRFSNFVANQITLL